MLFIHPLLILSMYLDVSNLGDDVHRLAMYKLPPWPSPQSFAVPRPAAAVATLCSFITIFSGRDYYSSLSGGRTMAARRELRGDPRQGPGARDRGGNRPALAGVL
jgi:hypothetical protein